MYRWVRFTELLLHAEVYHIKWWFFYLEKRDLPGKPGEKWEIMFSWKCIDELDWVDSTESTVCKMKIEKSLSYFMASTDVCKMKIRESPSYFMASTDVCKMKIEKSVSYCYTDVCKMKIESLLCKNIKMERWWRGEWAGSCAAHLLKKRRIMKRYQFQYLLHKIKKVTLGNYF